MSNQGIALLISTTVGADEDERALQGQGPRRDYSELAKALGAEILDHSRTLADRDPAVAGACRCAGINTALALLAYRRRAKYDVFFSDSERVGLPLAVLLKLGRARSRHVMVGHWLTPFLKAVPLQHLQLHTHIDRIACRIEMQLDVARRLGVPSEKLSVVPRGVDHHFWRPQLVQRGTFVFAAGLERRDYGTLIEAVRPIGVETLISAVSPWFDRHGLNQDAELPANVTVDKFDYVQLRDSYARSAAVVVPLLDLDFQAGITVILEAMAMGRPVIVSRTRGQVGAGVVRHGENGLYVPPGDVTALRAAISYLVEHAEEGERMGIAGRKLIEDNFTLDHFVSKIKGLIDPLLSQSLTDRVSSRV